MGLARVAMAFQLPFVIFVGLFATMYDVQKKTMYIRHTYIFGALLRVTQSESMS